MTKTKFIHKFILVNCMVFFCLALNAQEECTFTLSKAQKLYDAGSIEQIPEMLQPCIENGFTDEEKQQALKLIALAYLFDKNNKEADKAMLNFLKEYPEYEIGASDQAEFIQLFNTYRTYPIGSVGAVIMTNSAYPYATHLRETSPVVGKGTYSNSGIGFSGGVEYQQYIMPRLDISLEVLYVTDAYQYKSTNAENQGYLSFTETQGYLQFPFTVLYNPYNIWKLSTFVRGGVNVGYLLSSTATGQYSIQSNLSNPITYSGTNIISYRNPMQFWGIVGAGFNLNIIPHGTIMLDLRYNIGLKKQNNSVNDLNDFADKFGFNENDFKLNNLCVSVGIFYKLYKPVKKSK